MSGAPRIPRGLLPWLALLPLLPACQSLPATGISVSPESSVLAVDVVFPVPLGRDPSLVQVFFVRGPLDAGTEQLPELVPATFVKWSRAYLLDPEPGTWSVVAVTAAFAPPFDEDPIAGVTKTTWSGTSADAMIFPEPLIRETSTTIAPGDVAFMGVLRLRKGDRIQAGALFQGDLQERVAERIRPGAADKSGFAGWLARTWMVDLEHTSLGNDAGDRASFFDHARLDLGASPWAQVVARAAPARAKAATPRARAPAPKREAPVARRAAPTPEVIAANPQPSFPAPEPEAPSANPAHAQPQAAALVTNGSPPIPEQQRFSGIPPSSPLAEIELGMSYHDVRDLLGDPDARLDHSTAKAWIPFYTGPGAYLRDWIYEGEGRVVFSLHGGSLEVLDVVYDPDEGR